MKYPIGTNFYGWNLKEQIILGYMNFKGQEVYISNDVYDWQGNKVDYEDRIHGDILTEEEMQKEMELQSSRLATIQRHKEQAEEERRQQEAEAEEASCFGYCDTLSSMAAGKARNALYKSVIYKGQAVKKKDFIKTLADSGDYTAQEKFFSNYKKGKSPCYCIVHKDESFYTVSKTEYNLFKFLTEKEV